MGDEPDLDPEITKDFFEHNLLQFNAALLSENGMKYVLLNISLSLFSFLDNTSITRI